MHKVYSKISFCTTCMNRLDHLKETYVQNIVDNINYPNIEFVLLNYGSTDDLDKWVRKNLTEYIQKGIVNYFSTNEPTFFDRSKSRNITFFASTGDIICNLDADNYLGKDFAFYIDKKFSFNSNCFLVSDYGKPELNTSDVYGRICFNRYDLFLTNGFDESMDGYGWEEIDFINRLKHLGREETFIEKKEFLNAIVHNDELRVQNERRIKELVELYICPFNLEISSIISFDKDQKYILRFLIEKNEVEDLIDLESGRYISDESYILLTQNDQNFEYLKRLGEDKLIIRNAVYMMPNDSDELYNIIKLIDSLTNKKILNQNLKDKIVKVNTSRKGNIRVVINFQNFLSLNQF